MRRWQMTQQGLKSLFLVALLLAGCAASGNDSPAEGCGGIEASVSCLQVTNVAPASGSTNVDAHQDICVDPRTNPATITATETPLSDDNILITFANNQFPTAGNGFAIRLLGFSVSYNLNQCPALARGCPPLPGFTGSAPTTIIPLGGSATLPFPFVPLRVKQAYTMVGGELFSASLPSYTATYVFTAETVSFNDTITVTASAPFTIGDFLTNGFTCAPPGVVR
jgi:hypothetical protein